MADVSDDERVEEVFFSARGFLQGTEISSDYGGHIRAYESSSAEDPKLWVRIECPVDLNDPNGPTREGVVHLTLDNAVRFRDQLDKLIAHLVEGWER